MINNIKLSFCIPTYNRAQSILRLVTDILSCGDSNIEVVVLDNGSTDNTLSILHAIKDERLLIYSNGENKGALYNMINVLNKGRGTYLVYSTDQDYIDKNKIIDFKLFLLKNASLACGYCLFNSKTEIDYELFPAGYEAVKNIAYKGRHPTGYFFKNKLLKSISLVERFSDYNFVDLFPLEFVFAELSVLGDGGIYHKSIFTPETGVEVIKHKSSTTNGKSKNAFFSPAARLKLAINYAKHIDTLQLTQKEKELLVIDVFINGLSSATMGYKSVLENINLCMHYGMETRKLKLIEIIKIGFSFYESFLIKVIENNGNLKKIIKFKLMIFNIVCYKIIRKQFKKIN